MIGETIDRYLLLEKIGSGGMGEVYKARHTSLEQYRAIKVLPAYLSMNKELVERFFREARRCAALNHPNIVRLEHVGEQNGVYYMVMDYVEGKSLRQVIDEQAPLAPLRAMEIGREVCRALEYAHAQGVIHRDIKPSNILISPDGRPVLTDFGIARGMEGDEPGLTSAGVPMGTPEYMSPEQVRGEALDGRADLYALGVVLYEMCTGELPFTARSSNVVRRMQVERTPEPPSFYNPSLPPALDALILKALAKNPAERFASAAEMGRALDAALRAEARDQQFQGSGLDDAADQGELVGAGMGRASGLDQGRLGGAVEAPSRPESPSRPEARRRSTLIGDDAPRRAGMDEREPAPPRIDGDRFERGSGAPGIFERPTQVPGAGPRTNGAHADATRSVPAWQQSLRQGWDRLGNRRWIPAVLAALAAVVVVAILLQTLSGGAGPRFRADKGWDPRNGHEYGTVFANGIPVFIITTPQGDLTPSQRAERAADRLRSMMDNTDGHRGISPDNIVAMNTARGETVLAYRRRTQRGDEPEPNDVIVNVDDGTARTYAGVSRMALAAWWRDLLRDQLRLSQGREPVSTYDTPVGKVMDRVYQQTGENRGGGTVAPADVKKAIDDLPRADRRVLYGAWRSVPNSRRNLALAGVPGGDVIIPRKSASASDSMWGHAPGKVIDGNLNTTWESRHGFRVRGKLHALKINLTRQASVSSVEVLEGNNLPSASQLHIKRARLLFPDGTSTEMTRNTATDALHAVFPTRRASAVKLLVDEVFPNNRPGDARLSIAEVRVWGR